jgi:glutamate synthase (NADPH/NADH)
VISRCTFHIHLLICAFRGINEGRQCAREVDLYLEGITSLPVTGGIVKRSAKEILGKHLAHEIQGRAERATIQVTAAAN